MPWNTCHSEMYNLTSGKVERETELNEFSYGSAYMVHTPNPPSSLSG
jgi:hypothetical protein